MLHSHPVGKYGGFVQNVGTNGRQRLITETEEADALSVRSYEIKIRAITGLTPDMIQQKNVVGMRIKTYMDCNS